MVAGAVAAVALVVGLVWAAGGDDSPTPAAGPPTSPTPALATSTPASASTAASSMTSAAATTTTASSTTAVPSTATTAASTVTSAASPTTPATGAEAEPSTEPPSTSPADDDSGDPPPAPPPRRCASDDPVTTGTRPGPDPQAGRQWVAVGELHGVCDGTGPSFHVAGVDTRLVVRSDAPDITVYVVDDVQGEDATAGFPDGACTAPCAFEQPLVLPAGDYHLRVAAGEGAWEVDVEEYRVPG